uniref:LOW QUALITY PROTEIN: spliceosome-associated protein CWC15 homolog n=1 Tax=Myxine glutinosa TaxID=7769 RepID=UPI00358E9A73
MTTAARPTFEPAKGGRGKGEGELSALSKQYSSRDLPGHTTIKYRQSSQDVPEEVRGRDLRRELEVRERTAREKGRERSSRDHTNASSTKRLRLEQVPAANLDADDPADSQGSSDEDSEDESVALLAELQRIKKERAEQAARTEREAKVEEERIRTETILSGNPLIQLQAPNFKVKRRWDDDVVFKNCARGGRDGLRREGFINDTLRSDFHKKFMEKYIK